MEALWVDDEVWATELESAVVVSLELAELEDPDPAQPHSITASTANIAH